MSGTTFVASIPAAVTRPTPIYAGRGAVTGGELLLDLLREYRSSPHVLIADEHVYGLFGGPLAARLRLAGLDLRVLLVAPSESSKSSDVYLRLVGETLAAGVDKQSHVLTFGGGVTTNVGGFVAATVFRGLPLIHLPSSLMAQLDAAVDVRQAINHDRGKNLIGTMYAPAAVIIDPGLLATLPIRHIRSGFAEAIKHALTQSAPFLRRLRRNASRLGDIAHLQAVILETLRWKLKLLARGGPPHAAEPYLQYGHCLGHAIEAASRYELLHGEAIAIGMTVSARISAALGVGSPSLVDDHVAVLQAYGLPVSLPPDIDVDAVVAAATNDKNAVRGTPRLSLLRRVGQISRSGREPFAAIDASLLRRHLLGSRAGASAAMPRAITRRTGSTRSRRSG